MTLIIKKGERIRDVAYLSESSSRNKRRHCLFLCNCGEEFIANLSSVKTGNTNSCGCLQKDRARQANTVHGFAGRKTTSPMYKVWKNIKARCYNSNRDFWKDYGGRGITVCDKWIESPENFIKWASSNGYKNGLTIDRIDNNKGYSPDNCRFVTQKENSRNTRKNRFIEINGVSRCVSEWLEIKSIPRSTFYNRLKRGCSEYDAIQG